MTTRALELASQTLANELGRLWEVEKALSTAKSNHEYTQREHDSILEDAHKAMADFQEAKAEWERETKEEQHEE